MYYVIIQVREDKGYFGNILHGPDKVKLVNAAVGESKKNPVGSFLFLGEGLDFEAAYKDALQKGKASCEKRGINPEDVKWPL